MSQQFYFHKLCNQFVSEVGYQSARRDCVVVSADEYDRLLSQQKQQGGFLAYNAETKKVEVFHLPTEVHYTSEQLISFLKLSRNQWLKDSDWVALPDCDIDPDIKQEIITFRGKIRKLDSILGDQEIQDKFQELGRVLNVLDFFSLSERSKKILGVF